MINVVLRFEYCPFLSHFLPTPNNQFKNNQAFMEKGVKKGNWLRIVFKKGGGGGVEGGTLFSCLWKSIGNKFILYRILFFYLKKCFEVSFSCTFVNSNVFPLFLPVSELICHLPWAEERTHQIARFTTCMSSRFHLEVGSQPLCLPPRETFVISFTSFSL